MVLFFGFEGLHVLLAQDDNELGPKGGKALAGALEKLEGMHSLNLVGATVV